MLYKQIQKVLKISSLVFLGASLGVSLLAPLALAEPQTLEITCSDGSTITVNSYDTAGYAAACKNAGHLGYGSSSSDAIPDEPNVNPNDCNDTALNRDNCGIVRYLVIFINVLSAMVGIVVAAVIVIGGIQYSTSGGDPSKVQAAKKRIYNGIIALVAFIFTYAFLQYIVPGGIL